MAAIIAAQASTAYKSQVLRSEFYGAQQLRLPRASRPQAYSSRPMQVEMALTKERKAEQIQLLKNELSETVLIAGLEYKGLTVSQLQTFRRTLPKSTKLRIMKNTVLKQAIAGNDQWKALEPVAKGQNAWMFIKSDEELTVAIKAFRTLQKDLKLQSDFIGGVMEKKVLAPEDFKTLEKLPTKMELIAKIAGAINAIPTKVALSVKAIPNKVAYAAKAVADQKAEQDGASSS
eukprot:jgi/Chlat1/5585/Chrsp369S05358